MEELLELTAENADTLAKTGLGFTAGATVAYLHKYRCQRNGVEPFPRNNNPVYDKILEEDPIYGQDAYTENKLMEVYYDRFNTVQNNYKDAKASILTTVFIHGGNRFLLEDDTISFEDYPKIAGGAFAGIKAGKIVPTPKELSESFKQFIERE